MHICQSRCLRQWILLLNFSISIWFLSNWELLKQNMIYCVLCPLRFTNGIPCNKKWNTVTIEEPAVGHKTWIEFKSTATQDTCPHWPFRYLIFRFLGIRPYLVRCGLCRWDNLPDVIFVMIGKSGIQSDWLISHWKSITTLTFQSNIF